METVRPLAPPARPGAAAAAPGVLVVEDDPAIREVAVEALAGAGYRAVPAPDGAIALALLDGAGPPIGAVLLDLRLPGPDGRAVAAGLRARPGGAPPLIVFTAAPPAEAAAAAAALGAAGFVPKPFDLDALVAVVARCLAPPPAAAPSPPGSPGGQPPGPGAQGTPRVIKNIDPKQLRKGMQVQSGEGQPLGAIERTDADSITVEGQRYELSSIERIEGDRVYLTRQVGASPGAGRVRAEDTVQEAEGALRVPVHEERLEVDTRQTERGEVRVRTTVETEQQTVPVELEREEVHVEQTDTADRPATEAELAGAFREGTVRVPVRGEEAIARKETVVTGEVVIDKERTTETEQVTDTVRRERVEVDEHYDQARAAYQRDLATRPDAPTPEEAEPLFRTGYAAARDERYAGKAFEEVEPDLRAGAGAADEGTWERLKREVREGFDRARER